METREAELTIELIGVCSSRALHKRVMTALRFPDFYGHNWDAFWDAITGLVEGATSLASQRLARTGAMAATGGRNASAGTRSSASDASIVRSHGHLRLTRLSARNERS